MKTRIRAMVITLVATCALCCSLPSPAYAWNLDYYTDSVFASGHSLERGDYIGQHLYNYGIESNNAFWAGLGQSPAFNAAIQCINNDYLRATYFTVHDIYDVMVVHNNTISHISTNVTTIGTLIWQIQPVIDDIKDDLDDVLDNQVAIGTAVGNINTAVLSLASPIASISSKLTDVLTKIDSNAWHSKIEHDIYNGVTDALMGFVDDSSGVIWNSGLNSMGYSLADWMTIMLDEMGDINTKLQSGIDIANWPNSFVDLSNVESYMSRIVNVIERFNFKTLNYNGYPVTYLDIYLPSYNETSDSNSALSSWMRSTFASNIYNYLESIIDNMNAGFADIAALLQAGNVQDAVGDFNDVQFDANIDTLTSRIATLAPFGAVLMVAAELDMLQTQAVASPEMDLDFDFAGFHQVVHIDLSYLDTVQPFINWLVIILLVYNLLWYTVDFVKLEAAT